MEDRLRDLSGIPEQTIKDHNLEFLLDDEYIVPEGIFLYKAEVETFKRVQDEVYQMFQEELAHMVQTKDFNFLGLPSDMIDLIIHSFEQKHVHLLGRFDFSGGVNDVPIKLLEFNADMPTLLPESVIIQEGFNEFTGGKPYSEMVRRLEAVFNRLAIQYPNKEKILLGSSLGHEEDVANINIILACAENEGYDTIYVDLPDVEFAPNEGVFIQMSDGSYLKVDYFLKLIPWEFACFEEPELLNDLHGLLLNDLVYMLNPAYTMVYQSKAFLARLSEKYDSPYLLKTSHNARDFFGGSYVKKAQFGRLGENITIYDEMGRVIEKTEGELDLTNCIFQEFAELNKDSFNEYYQPGVYNVLGKAAGISFRRAEKLIIDNDCQFIPHVVK